MIRYVLPVWDRLFKCCLHALASSLLHAVRWRRYCGHKFIPNIGACSAVDPSPRMPVTAEEVTQKLKASLEAEDVVRDA